MFQFFFLPKKFSFSKNIHHMKSPPVSTRLEGCQFWILYWVRPWCVDQAPKLSCSLCCQKWQKQITCCFYHFTELALNLALKKLISWGLAKSLVQNDRTLWWLLSLQVLTWTWLQIYLGFLIFFRVNRMLIVAGDYSLSIYEGKEQEILPHYLVPHPGFDKDTNNNDLMLIKVLYPKSFPHNQYI